MSSDNSNSSNFLDSKIEPDYFSLEGLEINDALVVDVYDGDTITCVFLAEGRTVGVHKWRCRLVGINTPEIRTRDLEEKERGYAARDYLRDMILDKRVRVKCHKFGKFGRVLTDIYYTTPENGEEIHVNSDLISKGFAEVYEK